MSAGGIALLPPELGARSRRAEGDGPRRIGGPRPGEERLRGREALRAVCGRSMPMSIATPPAPKSRGPRSTRAADAWTAVTGRDPGRALPDPLAPRIFFFISFWLGGVALLTTALRSAGARERKGWGEGWGDARGTHLD